MTPIKNLKNLPLEKSEPTSNRESIVLFLKHLRDKIIAEFEQFEPKKRFCRTRWDHHTGGGGEISLIRGDIFEKAAVNWSGVQGPNFPMQDGSGPFFATGVSLITHMKNPHAPTVHFNIRYIETETETWFGGGYDLTPMGCAYEEDKVHFHAIAKKSLDQINPAYYPQFSLAAKEYFYIPHREKERGVGGIFFDKQKDLALWQSVGTSFLDAIIPIYKKRVHTPYQESERAIQAKFRGHYAEFNLLYDRGTRFGFASGGNPEAILCSMPPPLW